MSATAISESDGKASNENLFRRITVRLGDAVSARLFIVLQAVLSHSLPPEDAAELSRPLFVDRGAPCNTATANVTGGTRTGTDQLNDESSPIESSSRKRPRCSPVDAAPIAESEERFAEDLMQQWLDLVKRCGEASNPCEDQKEELEQSGFADPAILAMPISYCRILDGAVRAAGFSYRIRGTLSRPARSTIVTPVRSVLLPNHNPLILNTLLQCLEPTRKRGILEDAHVFSHPRKATMTGTEDVVVATEVTIEQLMELRAYIKAKGTLVGLPTRLNIALYTLMDHDDKAFDAREDPHRVAAFDAKAEEVLEQHNQVHGMLLEGVSALSTRCHYALWDSISDGMVEEIEAMNSTKELSRWFALIELTKGVTCRLADPFLRSSGSVLGPTLKGTSDQIENVLEKLLTEGTMRLLRSCFLPMLRGERCYSHCDELFRDELLHEVAFQRAEMEEGAQITLDTKSTCSKADSSDPFPQPYYVGMKHCIVVEILMVLVELVQLMLSVDPSLLEVVLGVMQSPHANIGSVVTTLKERLLLKSDLCRIEASIGRLVGLPLVCEVVERRVEWWRDSASAKAAFGLQIAVELWYEDCPIATLDQLPYDVRDARRVRALWKRVQPMADATYHDVNRDACIFVQTVERAKYGGYGVVVLRPLERLGVDDHGDVWMH